MRKSVILLGVAVGFFCATAPASAKRASKPKSNNNSNNSNNQNPNRQPPPVDNSLTNADKKKLADDRKEVTKAQLALNTVVNKLKAAFDSAPDHEATLAASKKAQADYETLRAQAIATIHDSPAYKSAVEEREQAAAKSAAGGGDTDSEATLAAARLEAGKKVTQLETEAVKADPRVAEAQAKATEWREAGGDECGISKVNQRRPRMAGRQGSAG